MIIQNIRSLNPCAAPIIFEDKPIWFALQRPVGSILVLVVLFTFYDGIFRRGKEVS